MQRFLRALLGLQPVHTAARGPLKRGLSLEMLEDRCVPSTLSGFVYNDANNNGVKDASETGLSSVTVTLSGSVNRTATTDSNGAYSFANLPSGTYTLRDATLSGYIDGQATAGSRGGSATAGTISGIQLGGGGLLNSILPLGDIVGPLLGAPPPASDGTGYNFGELARADGWSAIKSNFNGTAIQAGTTLWFSSVMTASNLGAGPVTMQLTGQSISFSAGGTNYRIAVPDSIITFDPNTTAASATTTFDTTANAWRTTLPMSFSGNGLLGAVAVPVTVRLPGGINPVTWQGDFTSDTPGVSVSWQWGAAVYSNFSTDYNAVHVKPLDVATAQYQNSDHAGTPEAFKQSVLGGARGFGGSNYTGSSSATGSVSPPLTSPRGTSSLSGQVLILDEGGNPGSGLAGVVLRLKDANGNVAATATTDANGFYTFTGLMAGSYSIQEDTSTLSGYSPNLASPGTVNGTQDGTEGSAEDSIEQILLGDGDMGVNYNFLVATV